MQTAPSSGVMQKTPDSTAPSSAEGLQPGCTTQACGSSQHLLACLPTFPCQKPPPPRISCPLTPWPLACYYEKLQSLFGARKINRSLLPPEDGFLRPLGSCSPACLTQGCIFLTFCMFIQVIPCFPSSALFMPFFPPSRQSSAFQGYPKTFMNTEKTLKTFKFEIKMRGISPILLLLSTIVYFTLLHLLFPSS